MADEEPKSIRSPRFTHWVGFLVFSTITLGSAVEAINNSAKTGKYGKWAVVTSGSTFVLTFIIVLLHLNSVTSLFIVGTKIEGLVCLVLCALWAVTVAIVSDSRHGLAVKTDGAVSNGNLYYFSWAGFVTSVTLLVSYLRSAFNVDVAGEIKTRSARLNIWAAHLAASLIVMGASANIFDNKCSGGKYTGATYCHRTVFGLVLGTLATVMALSIVGMKIATAKAPFLIEASFSIVLLVAYTFGVAYITSINGPGAPLGNLYYFTWIAFLSTFMLFASCIEDYNSAKSMTSQSDEDMLEEEDQI